MGALLLLRFQLLWLHHMVWRHLVHKFCSNHAGRLPLLCFQLLQHLPPSSSRLHPQGHTALLLHVAYWYHVGVLPLLGSFHCASYAFHFVLLKGITPNYPVWPGGLKLMCSCCCAPSFFGFCTWLE